MLVAMRYSLICSHQAPPSRRCPGLIRPAGSVLLDALRDLDAALPSTLSRRPRPNKDYPARRPAGKSPGPVRPPVRPGPPARPAGPGPIPCLYPRFIHPERSEGNGPAHRCPAAQPARRKENRTVIDNMNCPSHHDRPNRRYSRPDDPQPQRTHANAPASGRPTTTGNQKEDMAIRKCLTGPPRVRSPRPLARRDVDTPKHQATPVANSPLKKTPHTSTGYPQRQARRAQRVDEIFFSSLTVCSFGH